MTRRNTLAAIAMLLMAIVFVTGCQMSSSGNVPSTTDAMAVSAFRAMAQVADIETPVQNGDYKTYTPTEFKADDGSVISGTFQLDAEGNVVDANLTLTLVSGQKVQFTMVKQAETAQPEITVDDQYVSETVVPDTMADEEERAFLLFLKGFDEAQDEIRMRSEKLWRRSSSIFMIRIMILHQGKRQSRQACRSAVLLSLKEREEMTISRLSAAMYRSPI